VKAFIYGFTVNFDSCLPRAGAANSDAGSEIGALLPHGLEIGRVGVMPLCADRACACVSFLLSIWDLNAWARFTLPFLVNLMRFDSPLCVFSFGI
jgi:hypothetical protein